MTGAPMADILWEARAGRDEEAEWIISWILGAAISDPETPATRWLGLPPERIMALAERFFPHYQHFPKIFPPEENDDSLGEEDLRALILAHKSGCDPVETDLAAILARRAQSSRHLWEDMGLANRDGLNLLMRRYFAPLFALNVDDMRWKKFFSRALCEMDGVSLCKSPICDDCPDTIYCFEPDSRLLAHKKSGTV